MSHAFDRTVDLIAEQRVDAFARMLRCGGAIADIFAEESFSRAATLQVRRGRRSERGVGGRAFGAGLHVFDAGGSSFASTEDLSLEGLRRAADEVAHGFDSSQAAVTGADAALHSCADLPADALDAVSDAELLAILHRAADAALSLSPDVRAATIELKGRSTRFVVASSDGRFVRSARSRLGLRVHLEGRGGREAHAVGGGDGGLGVFLQRRPEDVAREAAERLRALEQSRDNAVCIGEQAVVIAGGWGGVWLHEVVGHALEADVAARGSSTIGRRVAGEDVSVVDAPGGFDGLDFGRAAADGHVVDPADAAGGTANSADERRRGAATDERGHTLDAPHDAIRFVDDEGTPGARTVLIEEGVVRAMLTDRLTAMRHGLPASGNGRRQSFRHPPLPRMTRLLLQPGPVVPEDLISAAGSGLYVTMIGSGRVFPAEDLFSFDVLEARIIENGRLGRSVTGLRLEGRPSEMLRRVLGVGNDFRIDPGRGACEKKGQVVDVSVGMPTILLDRVLVAGPRR